MHFKADDNEEVNNTKLTSDKDNDWHAFENTFIQGFISTNVNTIKSNDLISQLLDCSDDETFDTSFNKLIVKEKVNKSVRVTDSNENYVIFQESSCSSFSPGSEKIAFSVESPLSKPRCSKDKIKLKAKKGLQKRNEDSSFPVKTNQKLKIKTKKKNDVTRTVITETIFNGSIADNVKTRIRRSRGIENNSIDLPIHQKSKYSDVRIANKVHTTAKTCNSPSDLESRKSLDSPKQTTLKSSLSSLPKGKYRKKKRNKSGESPTTKFKRKYITSSDTDNSSTASHSESSITIMDRLRQLKKPTVVLTKAEWDKAEAAKVRIKHEVISQSSNNYGYSVNFVPCALSDTAQNSSEEPQIKCDPIDNISSVDSVESSVESMTFIETFHNIEKGMIEDDISNSPLGNTISQIKKPNNNRADFSSCVDHTFNHLPIKLEPIDNISSLGSLSCADIDSDCSKSNSYSNIEHCSPISNGTNCIKTANVPIGAKRKLRGIEEYRAHKAKCKQNILNQNTSISSQESSAISSPLSSPGHHNLYSGSEEKGEHITYTLEYFLNLFKSAAITPESKQHVSKETCPAANNYIYHASTPAVKPLSLPVSTRSDSESGKSNLQSTFPSFKCVKPKRSNEWESLSSSSSAKSSPELPSRQKIQSGFTPTCAFVADSSHSSMQKTSQLVPPSTLCPKMEAAFQMDCSGTAIVKNEPSTPPHSTPFPIENIKSEKNEASTSTNISKEQKLPETSHFRLTSQSSINPKLKKSRNYSFSSSYDSDSVSSCERPSRYCSRSPSFKRRLSKSKRNKSRPYRYSRKRFDSRYRKRRLHSRSRTRSHSRYSSSSDDFPYDIYKSPDMVAKRSISPSRHREKHSRIHGHSSKRRSHSTRRMSRSSHYHASSEHQKYSPSPPPSRNKHRRSRKYSSSSRSGNSCSRRHDSTSPSRSRSRSNDRCCNRKISSSRRRQLSWEEQQRQIDERRVVYVGLIPDGYTNSMLRNRFLSFGTILDVRIHKRITRRNDNYGFVTFKEKSDAYKAVEYGNDPPLEPKFDISFGGRKGFCKQEYSDLDKENELKEICNTPAVSQAEISFDSLLRAELQRVRMQTKKY